MAVLLLSSLVYFALLCTAMGKDKPDDCVLPPVTGMCMAYFTRYHYDPFTDTCKQFVFGGCQANANNFETKEDCESLCLD